ncbi:hypothetical protein POM88_008112 [Heracleum sosnowskyi]|uniref:Small ribosomal subunit protein uS5 C-terminal domain-containing protein n=1 Tax=Heracleum sosnowskyi TaxID=360622 RepID=A0AAD8J7E8_9APIA|nr:hypothetical protein POM88_008112 [Heracleum sosnowskyi]
MTIERAMNCGGLFIYRVIVCLQVPDKQQQQQVGFCSDPNLNTVATLGGIKDSSASSQNSLELDCLAHFAVDEHNKKETTLMQACQYSHWEVVLILVFFKANVICMELVYLTDLILKVSHLLIKLSVFHVFLELQAATPAHVIQNDVLDDDDDDEPLNDNDDFCFSELWQVEYFLLSSYWTASGDAIVICFLLATTDKKVLQFAGIEDVFTSSRGSTKTLGNFVKATFDCLLKTYGFLTPDFWTETRFTKSPYQEHTDLLAKPVSKITFTEDPVIEA